MKKLLYLLCIAFVCFGCSSLGQTHPSKKEAGSFKYIYGFIQDSLRNYRGRLDAYQPQFFPLTNRMDYIFETEGESRRVTLISHYVEKGEAKKNIIKYVPFGGFSEKDSLQFLPQKIGDFEFQGVYKDTSSVNEIVIHCFYLNPKTMDVARIAHVVYFGNVMIMDVLTHTNANPFTGHTEMFDAILNLDKAFNPNGNEVDTTIEFKSSQKP